MMLVDANVLIAAVNENDGNHGLARGWLEGALAGQQAVGFAGAVILAFLRLSTRRDLFANPLAVADAGAVAERWLDAPPSVVLHPTPRHLGLLRGLLEPLGTGGNLVGDAHLAALALEHGGEVITFDTDFARFPGLGWRLPGPSSP